jgi:hypothetical protein
MAAFTTESAVRLKFQLNDTATAPAVMVNGSIDDAHVLVTRFLDPAVDTETPADGLVLGETLLAGAQVLRALASKDAAHHQTLRVGGQVVDSDGRFSSLLALSAQIEKDAWQTLAPYLAPLPYLPPLRVTDTVPVIGENQD